MSDPFVSPNNPPSLPLKSALIPSKKVLNNANKHITNLLNSFITEYEQQSGAISISKTIRRNQTPLRRHPIKRQTSNLKDKLPPSLPPLNPTDPLLSSGSSTLRSSLHLIEEPTEHDIKPHPTNNNALTRYSLSKRNNSPISDKQCGSSSPRNNKYSDNLMEKHEYDASANSSSSYSRNSHKVRKGKHNRKSTVLPKVRKMTTMKPRKINPNISYLKQRQSMNGNNVIELNNINYLTHSNMVKLRNICDEIKLNICNDSSKQKIKNTERKKYANENEFVDNIERSNAAMGNNHLMESNFHDDHFNFQQNNNANDRFGEHSRSLQRKDQVYDSLDDEEIEDEIYDNFYISLNSRFVFILDVLIYFITVYSFIYTPLELAMHVRHISAKQIEIFFFIEVFIDIINCLDVVIRFFISYITFDEIEITKLKLIAMNYFFSWFIIDLIAACPFNSILLLNQIKVERSFHSFYTYSSYIKNLSHFFRLCRLFKSLKLLKANSFSSYVRSAFNKFSHFQRWSKVYVCLFGFLLSLHLLTSINIFVSRTNYRGWLSFYLPNNHNEGFYVTYIFSLYYILSTLLSIGYGDVLSQSMNERIFNLFLMFFGIMIYSFGISSISTYIMTKDAKTIEFEQKCSVLKEIKLTHEKMGDELYEKIYRFLYYRKTHEKRDKSVIFDALPIGLKNNLIYEMYKPIIQHFIFFRNFDNVEFIVKVIMCFQVFPCIKGEILVKEGDYLEEMFFVKNGHLSLQLPLPDVDQAISRSNNTNNLKNQRKLFFKKSSILLTKPLLRQHASLYALQNRVTYEDMMREEFLNKNMKKENNDEDKYTKIYVQILEIRKNEHFGDILMFLNLRSPLTVKVKSKRAELLLFKKTDAVSISVNYPQIWGRIIRRSLFNMEQIERLINRATKLFLDSNKTKIKKAMRRGGTNSSFKRLISRTNSNMKIKNINTFQSGSFLMKNQGVDVNGPHINLSIRGVRKDSNGRRFSDIYKIANINTSNIELKSIPSLSVTGSYYSKEYTNSYGNSITESNENKLEPSSEIKEVNESNSSSKSSVSISECINNTNPHNKTIIPKLKLDKEISIPNESDDSDKTQKEQNSLSNIILTTNNDHTSRANSPHSTESIDINCGINNISIHSQNVSLVSYYSFSSKNMHSCHANSFTLPAQYSNILTLYQNELTKAKQLIEALVQCGNNAYDSVYSSISQIAKQFENVNTNNSVIISDDKKSTLTRKLSRSSAKSKFQRANSLNNVISQKRMATKNFLMKKDSLLRSVAKRNEHLQKAQTHKINKQLSPTYGIINARKDDKEKNKNGLLTEIRENVEEDAFNLNNPEMFYAEYFQKIMDKEQKQILSSNIRNNEMNNNKKHQN